jgi:hypothetical protein
MMGRRKEEDARAELLRIESEEAAQRRVMDAVTGNEMVLVIQMRNHEKVVLVWKRLR